MSNVSTTCRDFVGRYAPINGKRVEDIGLPQLLWAGTTFGSQYYSAFSPTHAVLLGAYRAAALELAVDLSGAEGTRPTNYESLDPTEKNQLSFWLGMTFGVLLADMYLDVPHMHHGDSLRRAGRLNTPGTSKSLADFVGWDRQGIPHVLEAKGRKQRPSPNEEKPWKQQARTVRYVDGRAPGTCSYSAVFGEESLEALLVDPTRDDDGVEIEFVGGQRSAITHFLYLFQLFLRRFSGSKSVRHDGVRFGYVGVLPVSGQRLYVGLRDELYLQQGPALESRALESGSGDSGKFFLGRNGVACLLLPPTDDEIG